jgi:hypothetical protein
VGTPKENFGNWNLPFDLTQGGESFDSAQDREPAERLVEPFRISTRLLRLNASDGGQVFGFRIYNLL